SAQLSVNFQTDNCFPGIGHLFWVCQSSVVGGQLSLVFRLWSLDFGLWTLLSASCPRLLLYGLSQPGETPARLASSSNSLQRTFTLARAAANSLKRVIRAPRS